MNLSQMTCTCYSFYEYSGPCTHAITACRYEIEDPYTYFHWAYTIRSYRKTYHIPMKPISIEDLAPHPNVLPPKLRKLRGRPKTKRVRKNTWNRQKRKYRNYIQTGHNTRRYTSLPVAKNGRGKEYITSRKLKLIVLIVVLIVVLMIVVVT